MNLKPLLIVPPLALGVLGYMWMTQPQEATSTPFEPVPQSVRAIQVAALPKTLSATGFGRVEPVRSWTAVSQVDGRIVELAPDLAQGTVVESGALLVQIDPTDYELAVAKSRANIASAEATLAELESQEANSRRLLDIEQRIFDVAQTEYARVQSLFENGTTTAAALDTAQKTLLSQENAVINLTNTLELYPAQRASAEATLAVRQAELAEAQRQLENTTITAPFRGRLSAESVEEGQFVRTGGDLLSMEAIDVAEVVGAFQPESFASLMQVAVGPTLDDVSEIDATKVVSFMQAAGVDAFVALEFAERVVRYPAELTRFRGEVDDETSTLGLAVRVSDPLVASGAENRPPLEFGSFVSVVLEAQAGTGVIAIPRAAIQLGDDGAPFVFTANAEDQLTLSPVMLGPVAGDDVLIAEGLSDGDRVLLSTPRPSIAGMPLTVITQEAAQP